ncbi:carbamoyltransferase C-terminal domain-containing protein [Synechococcus sp. YX-04-1]|uniref:carbamoyltransferase family protein n=1 Tax=Synechococcus sp. YX-04-1 TaxID=3062778 RepID=UPI0026E40158|nr:carbamoyltransferase C-terminal domain-containing protein [Synechococcus sp. YX-04-1]MDO6351370.1 carbamoyltransferase C-terminal domain-containing protein [Synechococcus sp. YX-04-1]
MGTNKIRFFIGISCFYHDSGVSIIDEDQNVLFAQGEERVTRLKHDKNFPDLSIREGLKYILSKFRDSRSQIVFHVIYYENPNQKFRRILKSTKYFGSVDKALKLAFSYELRSKRKVKKLFDSHFQVIADELRDEYRFIDVSFKQTIFSRHHLSHALSSHHFASVSESVSIVIDGVGENISASIWKIDDNNHHLQWQLSYPHSIGLLYATFTSYLGFKVNSGEYKLMGLAPYGRPQFKDLLRKHIFKDDRAESLKLNLSMFNFSGFSKLYTKKLSNILPFRPIKNEDFFCDQNIADLASSIQSITEDIVVDLFDLAIKLNPNSVHFCYSGGVALNCKANEKIWNKCFKSSNRFFNVMPAAGDCGASLGAAFYGLRAHQNQRLLAKKTGSLTSPLSKDLSPTPFLGSSFKVSREFIDQISKSGEIELIETSGLDDALSIVASEIIKGKVVGFYQGKAEFGPRALGNRSILASPLGASTQRRVNLKIKYREDFRPFAPVTTPEDFHTYFDGAMNPYMLITARAKSSIGILPEECYETPVDISSYPLPAVTHLDGSARVQVVSQGFNPSLYKLLRKLGQYGHPPVLLNTSFNVRGEPVVHTPSDAVDCFLDTQMDYLFLDGSLFRKNLYREKPQRSFRPD